MRFPTLTALLTVILLGSAADYCRADVNVGLSIGDDGIKSFYLAIGEHYKVEERIVVKAKKSKIPDEELPVVFFLAKHAQVSPGIIIKLRLSGMPYMEICLKYGLTAEVFYVPMKRTPGPPYGKAYGHFKKKKKNDWGTIRFTDIEITNFVNLKFISSHYGHSPDEVAGMRANGTSFVTIHGKVKKARGPKEKLATSAPEKSKGRGKGKKK